MDWTILVIWFLGGPLDGLQAFLPFPTLDSCAAAMPEIERLYLNVGIEATYHCQPPTAIGEPA